MKKTLLFLCTAMVPIVLCGCSSAPYRSCAPYPLQQFAANEEELLITHEATGVIVGYAEYNGQYVVKINRNLWQQINAEQRMLIRCSAETVGYKKGLEGIVLDPKVNEVLN